MSKPTVTWRGRGGLGSRSIQNRVCWRSTCTRRCWSKRTRASSAPRPPPATTSQASPSRRAVRRSSPSAPELLKRPGRPRIGASPGIAAGGSASGRLRVEQHRGAQPAAGDVVLGVDAREEAAAGDRGRVGVNGCRDLSPLGAHRKAPTHPQTTGSVGRRRRRVPDPPLQAGPPYAVFGHAPSGGVEDGDGPDQGRQTRVVGRAQHRHAHAVGQPGGRQCGPAAAVAELHAPDLRSGQRDGRVLAFAVAPAGAVAEHERGGGRQGRAPTRDHVPQDHVDAPSGFGSVQVRRDSHRDRSGSPVEGPGPLRRLLPREGEAGLRGARLLRRRTSAPRRGRPARRGRAPPQPSEGAARGCGGGPLRSRPAAAPRRAGRRAESRAGQRDRRLQMGEETQSLGHAVAAGHHQPCTASPGRGQLAFEVTWAVHIAAVSR